MVPPIAKDIRCLWAGCSAPGPYQDERSLFEHLKTAHNPPPDGLFTCKWTGCPSKAGLSSKKQHRDRHLIRHTNYRRYGCTASDCGRTFYTSGELRQHHARHPAPASAACRCHWAACDDGDTVFPDATELRTHIERTHMPAAERGVRCGWQGCQHTFAGGNFREHLWIHLPAGFKPFVCTRPGCQKACTSTSSLKRHVHTMHKDEQEADGDESDDGDGDADTESEDRVTLFPAGAAAAPKRARGGQHSAGPAKRRRLDPQTVDSSDDDDDESFTDTTDETEPTRAELSRVRAELAAAETKIIELSAGKVTAEARVVDLEASEVELRQAHDDLLAKHADLGDQLNAAEDKIARLGAAKEAAETLVGELQDEKASAKSPNKQACGDEEDDWALCP